MTEDITRIEAALQSYGDAMKAGDLDALQSLWDNEYEQLIYQPEEYEQAITSWDDLLAYWRYIPTVVEQITEWDVLSADIAVFGDIALVYSRVHSAFVFAGGEGTLEGDVRFTFALRNTSAGWRFIHAHESRTLEQE